MEAGKLAMTPLAQRGSYGAKLQQVPTANHRGGRYPGEGKRGENCQYTATSKTGRCRSGKVKKTRAEEVRENRLKGGSHK